MAALSAGDSVTATLLDWPLDLVRLLISSLAREMLPALRLVSKTLAACIAPSITYLNVKAWPKPQQQQQTLSPGGLTSTSGCRPFQRLHFVNRVELNAPEMQLEHWAQLQHITSQLPLLHHVRIHSRMAKGAPLATKTITAACAAALSSVTRLDMPGAVFNINVPQVVQLPALRAASFGVVLGTDKLAAFAPHLQQLYCDHLQIGQHGAAYHAAMPSVTHLGANRVFKHNIGHFACEPAAPTGLAAAVDVEQQAATKTTAAAAAAGVQSHADGMCSLPFPNLRVLSTMPQGITYNNYDAVSALAGLSAITAIRGSGRFRDTQIWVQLAQQQQLQLLDLHDQYGVSAFQGVSQLTQLRALRLTGSCAGENASLVLQQVLELPRLQACALPAELLCKRCCPDVHASGALQEACRKRGLLQLVFVQLQPGFDCPHVNAVHEGLAALQSAAAAAAAAAASGGVETCEAEAMRGGSSQQCALQQQQQLHALQVQVSIEQNDEDEPAWKCTHQAADNVWGVYARSSSLLPGLVPV